MHKLVHSSWFIVHGILKKSINHLPLTINRRRLRPAFTLIEILVVISVMAVLAGGLLYSTNNARDKGKDARRKADLQAVAGALTSYFVDNHHYPPSDLVTNPSLDYVSYPYNTSWIPDLEGYIEKLPKDPLQAVLLAPLASIFESGKKIAGSGLSWLSTKQIAAQKPKGQVAAAGSYSGSPQVSADDGKRTSSTNPVWNNRFENTIVDNPTGTMFDCPNSRSQYIRFSNVSIPTDATNIKANIVFTPRHNGGGEDDSINSTNGPDTGNIKTVIRAELTTISAVQVTNGTDFLNRPKTSDLDTNGDGLPDSVEWNDIPFWWSGSSMTPVANRTTPNLAPLFQKLISQPGWNANPKAVNIFWLDNGSASNCPSGSGRIGVSRDGQDSSVNVGGIPSTAPILTISWDTPISGCTDATATNYNPLATVDDGSCIFPPTSVTAIACNDITTNVYCFRTSPDQKVFVLWTKLENENDPSLSTNPDALCRQTDPDFLNVPANTSPFKNLGKPDNSDFNYCIKSPQ